jgi:hypothetical protein
MVHEYWLPSSLCLRQAATGPSTKAQALSRGRFVAAGLQQHLFIHEVVCIELMGGDEAVGLA